MSEPTRRRSLGRAARAIARAELIAIEHAAREARRLGASAPPSAALRAVAAHAAAMLPRFTALIAGYGVPAARRGLGGALAELRTLVVARLVRNDERAFHIALLELRRGLDRVRLLREAARADQLLGVIRWCDDWMVTRRVLIAHAERELSWFALAHPHTAPRTPPARRDHVPPEPPGPHQSEPPPHDHR